MWVGLLFGILLGLFTSGHSFLAVAVTGAALGVAREGTVDRARSMLSEAGLLPPTEPTS